MHGDEIHPMRGAWNGGIKGVPAYFRGGLQRLKKEIEELLVVTEEHGLQLFYCVNGGGDVLGMGLEVLEGLCELFFILLME
jgi:hypothetical protein